MKSELLDELRDIMKRYVVLPPMAGEALALWVVHTYGFRLRKVTTYIGIGSPEKRCGKTTLLRLLGRLAKRALSAANISPSALFRAIEEMQPTLLIDEADTFLKGNDEMRGILNAGYNREGAYVIRVTNGAVRGSRFAVQGCSSKKRSRLARYSCWCPKVMAAIGRLPETLADRCIVITMQRKTAGDKCERMNSLKAEGVRARCAEFVRKHGEAIRKAQPEAPEALNDRAAEIWEPLFVIADLAGGEWPELARQAALRLSRVEDEPTLLAYLLKDLRNMMAIKEVDRMLSREIVEILNPMRGRPWEDLRRGRELNEWWLGWQLRDLGIRSRALRVNGMVGKGYWLEDLEEAYRRYGAEGESSKFQVPSSNEEGALTLPEYIARKELGVELGTESR